MVETRGLSFHFFFFSSRRRHTRLQGDWSSDVCSSDLVVPLCQIFLQIIERVTMLGEDQEFSATILEFGELRFAKALLECSELGVARAFQIGRASCRERV